MSLRKWQKIQEMLRISLARLSAALPLFALAAAAALPSRAGIWTDALAGYTRTSAVAPPITDKPLWDEYGFEQAERAQYESAKGKFTGTAWRVKDSTAALAVFDGMVPADAKPTKVTELSVETANGALLGFRNYVLLFEGFKPQPDEINLFLTRLPKLDQSPLPNDYLPAAGLIPNSRRYVLGPAGLDRYLPGISPSLAAFSMGAEAQIGRFNVPGGPIELSVFSYPTPQIARQRFAEFQQLPGARARRDGPLVALIRGAKDADAAERLLALVKFPASVTESQRLPTRRDNVGDLIMNIFILIGILMSLFIVAGLAFGFLRRWAWAGKDDDAMTVLRLHDR
jgi:hypothetical protein